MIINQRKIARARIEKLKEGFTAYSETTLVTELIERYIKEQKIEVHVEKTDLGCWFTPVKKAASDAS